VRHIYIARNGDGDDGDLKVDVDGSTADVDEAVEVVVFTADRLLCAACTTASTDGRDGGAVRANVSASGDRQTQQGQHGVDFVAAATLLYRVATLDRASVTLATATRSARRRATLGTEGWGTTPSGAFGRQTTGHALGVSLSRDNSGSSSKSKDVCELHCVLMGLSELGVS
jgi:hypothetical protein